jgi:hypothetical protein
LCLRFGFAGTPLARDGASAVTGATGAAVARDVSLVFATPPAGSSPLASLLTNACLGSFADRLRARGGGGRVRGACRVSRGRGGEREEQALLRSETPRLLAIVNTFDLGSRMVVGCALTVTLTLGSRGSTSSTRPPMQNKSTHENSLKQFWQERCSPRKGVALLPVRRRHPRREVSGGLDSAKVLD